MCSGKWMCKAFQKDLMKVKKRTTDLVFLRSPLCHLRWSFPGDPYFLTIAFLISRLLNKQTLGSLREGGRWGEIEDWLSEIGFWANESISLISSLLSVCSFLFIISRFGVGCWKWWFPTSSVSKVESIAPYVKCWEGSRVQEISYITHFWKGRNWAPLLGTNLSLLLSDEWVPSLPSDEELLSSFLHPTTFVGQMRLVLFVDVAPLLEQYPLVYLELIPSKSSPSPSTLHILARPTLEIHISEPNIV